MSSCTENLLITANHQGSLLGGLFTFLPVIDETLQCKFAQISSEPLGEFRPICADKELLWLRQDLARRLVQVI